MDQKPGHSGWGQQISAVPILLPVTPGGKLECCERTDLYRPLPSSQPNWNGIPSCMGRVPFNLPNVGTIGQCCARCTAGSSQMEPWFVPGMSPAASAGPSFGHLPGVARDVSPRIWIPEGFLHNQNHGNSVHLRLGQNSILEPQSYIKGKCGNQSEVRQEIGILDGGNRVKLPKYEQRKVFQDMKKKEKTVVQNRHDQGAQRHPFSGSTREIHQQHLDSVMHDHGDLVHRFPVSVERNEYYSHEGDSVGILSRRNMIEIPPSPSRNCLHTSYSQIHREPCENILFSQHLCKNVSACRPVSPCQYHIQAVPPSRFQIPPHSSGPGNLNHQQLDHYSLPLNCNCQRSKLTQKIITPTNSFSWSKGNECTSQYHSANGFHGGSPNLSATSKLGQFESFSVLNVKKECTSVIGSDRNIADEFIKKVKERNMGKACLSKQAFRHGNGDSCSWHEGEGWAATASDTSMSDITESISNPSQHLTSSTDSSDDLESDGQAISHKIPPSTPVNYKKYCKRTISTPKRNHIVFQKPSFDVSRIEWEERDECALNIANSDDESIASLDPEPLPKSPIHVPMTGPDLGSCQKQTIHDMRNSSFVDQQHSQLSVSTSERSNQYNKTAADVLKRDQTSTCIKKSSGIKSDVEEEHHSSKVYFFTQSSDSLNTENVQKLSQDFGLVEQKHQAGDQRNNAITSTEGLSVECDTDAGSEDYHTACDTTQSPIQISGNLEPKCSEKTVCQPCRRKISFSQVLPHKLPNVFCPPNGEAEQPENLHKTENENILPIKSLHGCTEPANVCRPQKGKEHTSPDHTSFGMSLYTNVNMPDEISLTQKSVIADCNGCVLQPCLNLSPPIVGELKCDNPSRSEILPQSEKADHSESSIVNDLAYEEADCQSTPCCADSKIASELEKSLGNDTCHEMVGGEDTCSGGFESGKLVVPLGGNKENFESRNPVLCSTEHEMSLWSPNIPNFIESVPDLGYETSTRNSGIENRALNLLPGIKESDEKNARGTRMKLSSTDVPNMTCFNSVSLSEVNCEASDAQSSKEPGKESWRVKAGYNLRQSFSTKSDSGMKEQLSDSALKMARNLENVSSASAAPSELMDTADCDFNCNSDIFIAIPPGGNPDCETIMYCEDRNIGSAYTPLDDCDNSVMPLSSEVSQPKRGRHKKREDAVIKCDPLTTQHVTLSNKRQLRQVKTPPNCFCCSSQFNVQGKKGKLKNKNSEISCFTSLTNRTLGTGSLAANAVALSAPTALKQRRGRPRKEIKGTNSEIGHIASSTKGTLGVGSLATNVVASSPPPVLKRKRGRRRKGTNLCFSSPQSTGKGAPMIKRKRGRPRKETKGTESILHLPDVSLGATKCSQLLSTSPERCTSQKTTSSRIRSPHGDMLIENDLEGRQPEICCVGQKGSFHDSNLSGTSCRPTAAPRNLARYWLDVFNDAEEDCKNDLLQAIHSSFNDEAILGEEISFTRDSEEQEDEGSVQTPTCARAEEGDSRENVGFKQQDQFLFNVRSCKTISKPLSEKNLNSSILKRNIFGQPEDIVLDVDNMHFGESGGLNFNDWKSRTSTIPQNMPVCASGSEQKRLVLYSLRCKKIYPIMGKSSCSSVTNKNSLQFQEFADECRECSVCICRVNDKEVQWEPLPHGHIATLRKSHYSHSNEMNIHVHKFNCFCGMTFLSFKKLQHHLNSTHSSSVTGSFPIAEVKRSLFLSEEVCGKAKWHKLRRDRRAVIQHTKEDLDTKTESAGDHESKLKAKHGNGPVDDICFSNPSCPTLGAVQCQLEGNHEGLPRSIEMVSSIEESLHEPTTSAFSGGIPSPRRSLPKGKELFSTEEIHLKSNTGYKVQQKSVSQHNQECQLFDGANLLNFIDIGESSTVGERVKTNPLRTSTAKTFLCEEDTGRKRKHSSPHLLVGAKSKLRKGRKSALKSSIARTRRTKQMTQSLCKGKEQHLRDSGSLATIGKWKLPSSKGPKFQLVKGDSKKRKGGPVLGCYFCDFTCRGVKAKNLHVKQEHPYHCRKCKVMFSSKADAVSHRKTHIAVLHHCLLCEVACTCDRTYKIHVAGNHHRKLEEVQRDTIEKMKANYKLIPQHIKAATVDPKEIGQFSQEGRADVATHVDTIGKGNSVKQPTEQQLQDGEDFVDTDPIHQIAQARQITYHYHVHPDLRSLVDVVENNIYHMTPLMETLNHASFSVKGKNSAATVGGSAVEVLDAVQEPTPKTNHNETLEQMYPNTDNGQMGNEENGTRTQYSNSLMDLLLAEDDECGNDEHTIQEQYEQLLSEIANDIYTVCDDGFPAESEKAVEEYVEADMEPQDNQNVHANMSSDPDGIISMPEGSSWLCPLQTFAEETQKLPEMQHSASKMNSTSKISISEKSLGEFGQLKTSEQEENNPSMETHRLELNMNYEFIPGNSSDDYHIPALTDDENNNSQQYKSGSHDSVFVTEINQKDCHENQSRNEILPTVPVYLESGLLKEHGKVKKLEKMTKIQQCQKRDTLQKNEDKQEDENLSDVQVSPNTYNLQNNCVGPIYENQPITLLLPNKDILENDTKKHDASLFVNHENCSDLSLNVNCEAESACMADTDNGHMSSFSDEGNKFDVTSDDEFSNVSLLGSSIQLSLAVEENI